MLINVDEFTVLCCSAAVLTDIFNCSLPVFQSIVMGLG